MSENNFSESQKQYLAGFTMGADVARAVRGLPILSGSGGRSVAVQVGGSPSPATAQSPSTPDQLAWQAQNRFLESGKKLANEEKAKREKNPLDMWDEIAARAQAGKFPKGSDVFLTKFHGLFYVAPAQDSFMCRLRFPGGELTAYQLNELADLAERAAGGTLDVTTRANLQIREIPADQAMTILYGLRDAGVVNLGSGGDNIRNVTASPLSGIDPTELTETLPIAKRMQHYIAQHRDMYGLPRKFNIAYDGGGSISALEDTNDIGFSAVEITSQNATAEIPAGVYYQLNLGGITGHGDFARDTGILLTADETLEVAGAIVRVFVQHGDRTDRQRARLKYLLDDWGFERFLQSVEQELGRTLRRKSIKVEQRPASEQRRAHVGFHAQRQPGKKYVGVVLPVGRMTSEQARGVAELARRYGSGRLRLTVWQNLLIPDIRHADCDAVALALVDLGLDYRATNFRAGLIACTGSAGCKFAAANTKRHAMQIAEYLESHFQLDSPLNIHLTGCHHSCAQHYIGDIGLIATKVEVDEEMVEGYDIYLGGGWGERQAIARKFAEKVVVADVPAVLGSIVAGYLERRQPDEAFHVFTARQSTEDLQSLGYASVPSSHER